MGIATVNPATEETIKTFEPISAGEIDRKIALADTVYQSYRKTSMAQRSQWLYKAAEILERDQVKYGQLMTLEMGKPVKSAIAEVRKCALVCRYYAENAPDFLKDVPASTDATTSYVRYLPLGIILAVMPWNFPFWQVFRFAAPALMAGNVGLLKHASNVPQCALAIEEIIREAGFPEGSFQTLLIGASQVEQVIRNSCVKAATLTGSEPAGASLASVAGAEIKKTVLELGGSDPFIVLESANIEEAVNTAVTARMLNNGQSCIAAKRFILMESIAEQFETQLLEKFKALKVGDPMDENTDIGPLATRSILEEIDQQVQASVNKGAKVVLGGKALEGKGNYYLPTILNNIDSDCPAYLEEFFGPVASVYRVNSLDEAIELANVTSFGLGASAWTGNSEEAERLINEVEAGCVFINGMVKSDPRLPFGGIKRSGYGRELGIQGIHEFVNTKTVWIK
ncbi:MAG: NAD-dependent succinate-semialdehyde dehydrogenase [Microcystaceae cyanobacterium]